MISLKQCNDKSCEISSLYSPFLQQAAEHLSGLANTFNTYLALTVMLVGLNSAMFDSLTSFQMENTSFSGDLVSYLMSMTILIVSVLIGFGFDAFFVDSPRAQRIEDHKQYLIGLYALEGIHDILGQDAVRQKRKSIKNTVFGDFGEKAQDLHNIFKMGSLSVLPALFGLGIFLINIPNGVFMAVFTALISAVTTWTSIFFLIDFTQKMKDANMVKSKLFIPAVNEVMSHANTKQSTLKNKTEISPSIHHKATRALRKATIFYWSSFGIIMPIFFALTWYLATSTFYEVTGDINASAINGMVIASISCFLKHFLTLIISNAQMSNYQDLLIMNGYGSNKATNYEGFVLSENYRKANIALGILVLLLTIFDIVLLVKIRSEMGYESNLDGSNLLTYALIVFALIGAAINCVFLTRKRLVKSFMSFNVEEDSPPPSMLNSGPSNNGNTPHRVNETTPMWEQGFID